MSRIKTQASEDKEDKVVTLYAVDGGKMDTAGKGPPDGTWLLDINEGETFLVRWKMRYAQQLPVGAKAKMDKWSVNQAFEFAYELEDAGGNMHWWAPREFCEMFDLVKVFRENE